MAKKEKSPDDAAEPRPAEAQASEPAPAASPGQPPAVPEPPAIPQPPTLPPPGLAPPPLARPHSATGQQLDAYFSFRTLFASTLIEILSAVGHVVLTALGICMLFKWIPWCHPWPWAGLATLVLANFAWRVLCELFIVICRIHERLVSIDERLKRGG
jgi:hypothetical protein